MSLNEILARAEAIFLSLKDSGMRSNVLDIDASAHKYEYFYKILVNYISAAEIIRSFSGDKTKPISITPLLTPSTYYTDIKVMFRSEVHPLDTNVVLSNENNGLLATETDIFVRDNAAPFLTAIPYMGIDFLGTGTTPLQFIYDLLRTLHKASLSRRREYPKNESGMNVSLSSKEGVAICEISLIARYKGIFAPFFEDVALRYE